MKQKLKESTIGARIQAVTLLEIKVPIVKITARTGLSKAGIYRWWHEAVKRGWNQTGVVEVEYVSNKERLGRPKISEALENFILFTMLKNSTTRIWSCRRISYEVSNCNSMPVRGNSRLCCLRYIYSVRRVQFVLNTVVFWLKWQVYKPNHTVTTVFRTTGLLCSSRVFQNCYLRWANKALAKYLSLGA